MLVIDTWPTPYPLGLDSNPKLCPGNLDRTDDRSLCSGMSAQNLPRLSSLRSQGPASSMVSSETKAYSKESLLVYSLVCNSWGNSKDTLEDTACSFRGGLEPGFPPRPPKDWICDVKGGNFTPIPSFASGRTGVKNTLEKEYMSWQVVTITPARFHSNLAPCCHSKNMQSELWLGETVPVTATIGWCNHDARGI